MTREWESALDRGDVAALRRLLDDGADVNALDRYGQTSLMRAAHRGDLNVATLLIERRADLNHTAKYRLSALMLAVIAGHEALVGALVQAGADPTLMGSGAPGFAGKTARDLAAAAGRAAIVAILDRR
jgi:ankyrin repeat protein